MSLYAELACRENRCMEIFKTIALFVATALAEIVGCYLPYLWLKQDKSAWLLLPATVADTPAPSPLRAPPWSHHGVGPLDRAHLLGQHGPLRPVHH